MNNREKAKIVFKEELGFIESKAIRDFVLEGFFEFTPDYFWDCPSSSSGKHHPKISNKKHGLVLHTKLCVWWARKLYESMENKNSNLDIVIAACLLHDLQKFGTKLNEDGSPTLSKYASVHGVLLAVLLEDIKESLASFESIRKEINVIIQSVAMHMGKWTNASISDKYSDISDNYNMILLVHLADYCASKKVDDKTDRLNKWIFPREAL